MSETYDAEVVIFEVEDELMKKMRDKSRQAEGRLASMGAACCLGEAEGLKTALRLLREKASQ